MRFGSFVGLIMAVVVLSIGLASTSGCSSGTSSSTDISSTQELTIELPKGNDNSTKTELTAKELASKLAGEKLVIIDVNPLAQFKEGHIQGAIQGDLNSLRRTAETYLNQLGVKKTDTIVLVCETGNRSAITLPFLVKAGYSTVYNLRDGNLGWLRAGFTLVKEYPHTVTGYISVKTRLS